jgi:hypothetical protein
LARSSVCGSTISQSWVWRRQKRWRRDEKQRPNHHVQIDVKFVEPITTSAGGTRKTYHQKHRDR